MFSGWIIKKVYYSLIFQKIAQCVTNCTVFIDENGECNVAINVLVCDIDSHSVQKYLSSLDKTVLAIIFYKWGVGSDKTKIIFGVI